MKDRFNEMYDLIEADYNCSEWARTCDFKKRWVEYFKESEEIKKALENNPDNPARLDSMGWAYYKKGEYNLAQTFLRKAYSIAPKEKEIMEHLRIVLSKSK